MRKFPSVLKTAGSALALAGSIALLPVTGVVLAEDATSTVAQGKAVAFDRKKGNCLACHQIAGGDLPGNIGPPLVAMKARFPDKAKLRAQIADPHTINPNSIMPPFGRQQILTDAEIDQVVEYIHTL